MQAFPHICFHPTLPQISKNTTKNLPSVHLFRQKSTKLGHEVNPFSMDWGEQMAKIVLDSV